MSRSGAKESIRKPTTKRTILTSSPPKMASAIVLTTKETARNKQPISSLPMAIGKDEIGCLFRAVSFVVNTIAEAIFGGDDVKIVLLVVGFRILSFAPLRDIFITAVGEIGAHDRRPAGHAAAMAMAAA